MLKLWTYKSYYNSSYSKLNKSTSLFRKNSTYKFFSKYHTFIVVKSFIWAYYNTSKYLLLQKYPKKFS